MKINGKSLDKCYIIAELSANHNGDFERAKAIIKAAADAGADAIKLQTYKPETITLNSRGAE
ncbi:MAG: N-acetylneuraminate synthase family protein, partial [Campylobacteraceae bacterium]|nr:N-acetylneuraminate synthase family protein [Campylobacteraceae bacterium]MDY4120758.1 N-acetylneuraminate synthase family protein [Campylobacter sp.]